MIKILSLNSIVKGESEADIVGLEFMCHRSKYVYLYKNNKLEKLK